MINMSLKDFVLPLISSIDKNNYLLKSHHRRVTMIAYEIGKEMQLSKKELADLVIAASVHDIGILSIQDKNRLLEHDLYDPKPHCEMGYEIIRACSAFKNVADIIRHHHIFYYEEFRYGTDVKIQSHIIHLADRVEIFIDKDVPLSEQQNYIKEEIKERCGTTFHPKVCQAFFNASSRTDFWEALDLTLETVFEEIDEWFDIPLTEEIITGFSTLMARAVDYRCNFTAAHSFTVGNIAQYIGEKLQYDDEFKFQLLIAGLLHDIGKLAINPYIVTKKAELSTNEYDEVKKIPEYNKVILQDLMTSPWFTNIVDWIAQRKPSHNLSQEEKRTLGNDIIELSHIITALMEQRPYRESFSIDKSLDIITKEHESLAQSKAFQYVKNHKEEINEMVQTFQEQANKHFENIERDFDYL